MADKGQVRILVVEDTPTASRFCQLVLSQAGHRVQVAETAAKAKQAMATERPDLVLLDLSLPDMPGLELLKLIVPEHGIPVIVVTADASVRTAVEAMRQGALDFVVKPFKAERLTGAIADALSADTSKPRAKPQKARDVAEHRFIGESEPMQRVYRTIRAAAPSTATILITGESGTGKEVAAETVHSLSNRANAPFVAINCGAIPKDLIESELFGHLKGSFTGATTDRVGACKLANGGTLFLDEICEMQLELQTKLLRFLQSGVIQPVGSSRVEKVDVRIVCATNRNPLEEVRTGRFREDLYYRLQVVPIEMPPLRQRGDDVVLLARAFVARYAAEEGKQFRSLDREGEELLRGYFWPGNVRQLQNTLRRAVVMNDGTLVTPAMLRQADLFDAPGLVCENASDSFDEPSGPTSEFVRWQTPKDIREMSCIEKIVIERAIELCEGNVSKAAGFLGLSPSTIYRKRQEWVA